MLQTPVSSERPLVLSWQWANLACLSEGSIRRFIALVRGGVTAIPGVAFRATSWPGRVAVLCWPVLCSAIVDHARAIRAAATELGFIRCGFSVIEPLPRDRFLRNWLDEGRPGGMAYLGCRFHERMDPRLLFPKARSVVSLAHAYPPAPSVLRNWQGELRGRIAAYAWGQDYHRVVGKRLSHLAGQISRLAPGAEARYYIDTGPILEREWGHRAGLGWFGRNTMLLDQRAGSWFFLGEILTNLDLPGGPPAADRCGACRRCRDACPTGALDIDYQIDPRLCISYLTIEHRSAIPQEIRPKLGNWLFGCDTCQEVCPWNRSPGDPAAFEFLNPQLPAVLDLEPAAFHARYQGTALTRTKRVGLLRNAAVAAGNSGNREAVPALARALSDPEPLVRCHAAWALGRLGGPLASTVLERARHSAASTDPAVREEIERALEEARDGASNRS